MERLDSEEPIEPEDGAGLLGGLSAYEIRILVENPWNGGGGYSYEQVGKMTLDQIWSRLCDIELLKRPVGMRTKKMSPEAAVGGLQRSEDGTVRGRAADGTPIRGRVGGISKARMLMIKQQQEAAARKKNNDKQRR